MAKERVAFEPRSKSMRGILGKSGALLDCIDIAGRVPPKARRCDSRLFFLRKQNGKPIVLDYSGNDSRPVTDSQDQIDTLHRLNKIGNFGIVRGKVWRPYSFEGTPVGHVNVRDENDWWTRLVREAPL